jgi:hypothetical protein
VQRVCVLVAALSGTLLAAQSVSPEYELKATFLFNFMKYVEWPASASSGPIVVCVAGQNPFGSALENVLRKEKINGRSIDTPRVILEPEPCHVIFIPRTANIGAYLRAAKGTPTLLVGESMDFLEQGGIINFVMGGNQVRFQIDVEAAERSGLRISSRLLRLRYVPENRGAR